MACRAVLFAITDADVSRFLAAEGDAAVMEVVESIEEQWDEEWLCYLDKSWDGLHRCFTDGELGYDNGEYPLNHAILGGKQLHERDDYIIALVMPEQVKDVAKALQTIAEADLKTRYWRINRNNYGFVPDQLCTEDLEYIEEYLAEVKPFYAKAAKATRAVVFTVDQ